MYLEYIIIFWSKKHYTCIKAIKVIEPNSLPTTTPTDVEFLSNHCTVMVTSENKKNKNSDLLVFLDKQMQKI